MTKEEYIKNKTDGVMILLQEDLELLEQIFDEDIEPREKRIAELEAQIEEMKCCSICKYYSMSFIPYWCTKNSTTPHCTSKCDKWEFGK